MTMQVNGRKNDGLSAAAGSLESEDRSDFARARRETLAYHSEYYRRYRLFDESSWLARPDAGLMQLVNDYLMLRREPEEPVRILDLGCGVGRNAVPVAMALKEAAVPCLITAVDVLAESIELLRENAEKYGVPTSIEAVVADNDCLVIAERSFDLIAAISVLEHCAGVERLGQLLGAIAGGLKDGGLARIEMTTDRHVVDLLSGRPVPTCVETPLTENAVRQMLAEAFRAEDEYEVLSLEVFPYSEELEKDGRRVLWQSRQISLAVRRRQRQ